MPDMVEQTSVNARTQIKVIEEKMTLMGREIQRALPNIYAKDLIEVLFQLPYTKRSYLEKQV